MGQGRKKQKEATRAYGQKRGKTSLFFHIFTFLLILFTKEASNDPNILTEDEQRQSPDSGDK